MSKRFISKPWKNRTWAPLVLVFICLFLEWLQKRFSPLLFNSAFDTHIYIMYTRKVCCGRYCVTSWYRTFTIYTHRRRFDFKLGLVEPTFNWLVVCSGFLVYQNFFFFFFFFFFYFILLWGSCLPAFLLFEDPKFIFCAGVQSIKYCNLHNFNGHQYWYRKQASDGPSCRYQAIKFKNVWLQLRNHPKMRTINYGPFRTMVNVFSYKALKRGILEI